MSYSSEAVVPSLSCHVTFLRPPSVSSTAVGTAPSRNSIFAVSSMYVLMCPAICWSKPRSGIERIITVVSKPTPLMKPAHSRATYDAPTTSVLPGGVFIAKTSSEVMQCSFAPGMSGYRGRPPVATTNLSAVSVCVFPFLSTAVTVLASVNVAYAL